MAVVGYRPAVCAAVAGRGHVVSSSVSPLSFTLPTISSSLLFLLSVFSIWR